MTPPQIRYPLPTLIVLIGLILIARFAAPATRPLRRAISARWTRVVEGPPVPSSMTPKVVAGPVVQRVLLLKEGVDACEKPGGAVSETIGKRMFADIYDVWPLTGAPNFYRIGNRHPFGWVRAAEVLPWNSRLVIKPAAHATSGSSSEGNAAPAPLPVLAQEGSQIRVAAWDVDQSWEKVGRIRTLADSDVAAESWGVFLSRDDLLALLRQMMLSAPEPAESLRLRAVLGRLGSGGAFSAADIQAARRVLPPRVFADHKVDMKDAVEQLARLNEQWQPDAAWSGLTFQFVPLDALP